MLCYYCNTPTDNYLELGRGNTVKKIPCCISCFQGIDTFPQDQKDKMAEAAFIDATLKE